jgi:CRP/FNR family transcriptional regulator, cyclic AMP receptor protein
VAAPAHSIEASGLEINGYCDDLAERASLWQHGAALVEDLTSAEIATLGALMPMVRAKAGQALIREGDTGDWMLLILSGTVDVTKATDSGVPSRVAVIQTGAAVGEMSLLDGSPRYATCTAISNVEAAILTRATISVLIKAHPAIGAKLLVQLMQILARRLRNASNQVVRLVQKAGQSVKIGD